MKFKIKHKLKACSFHCLMLSLLFVFITQTNARISSTMYSINTIDSLADYYEESSQYTKTYILRYLPDWLIAKGYGSGTVWVDTTVERALHAESGSLVCEAIKLTGKYNINIPVNANRLIELYEIAHREYNVDGTSIRNAVINAFKKISGSYAENAVTQMICNTPRIVLESEFTNLIEAAAVFGDTLLLPELNSIETYIKNKISSVNPGDDPHLIPRYKEVLQYVYIAKEEIIERGGQ